MTKAEKRDETAYRVMTKAEKRVETDKNPDERLRKKMMKQTDRAQTKGRE